MITLNNIFFIENTPVMTSASRSYLHNNMKYLDPYKVNSIEIRGHTSFNDSKVRQDTPLYKLSNKRAETIYYFLINEGFNPSKLSYKGFGNTQLQYRKPANSAEQRKNSRIEIVVFKNQ